MRNWPRLAISAVGLAAFVWIGQAAPLQSQAPLFAPGTPVTVGAGPGEVVLADLNQDGHLDMVTRHLLQKRISVLLGDGKGGFTSAPGSPMTLAYQPGAMQLADINGDGASDLVVSVSERDAVDVFLGDRKGGFSRVAGSPFNTSASAQFYTRGAHLADVNGDGRLDVLTANGAEHTVGVLFGDGRGAFTPGPTTRLGFSGGRSVCAFGDVDGDGRLDVIAAHRAGGDEGQPSRVAILRGDGKGNFKATGSAVNVAPGPFVLTLADVNGDRHPDLMITHGKTPLLTVLMNDGHGAFTAAAGSPIDIHAEAYNAVVVDVDGDMRADILAATGSSVVVLRGDGRGGFTPAPGSPYAAGPGAYGLAVGDINEDGKLDVIASSFEGNAVTVFLRR